jgi:hypothetical protein
MRTILVAFGALIVAFTSSAQTPSQAEYRIKAVFLFNFVQFVQWPPSAFADERAPLVICVVGNDPFGDALDQTVTGESTGTRKLVLRRATDAEKLDSCHMLFVSRSEQTRVGAVLQSIGPSNPVLTVSDIDNFVERGGAIGFFLERNRVRFEISPTEAQRRGLKVSAQLLDLGRIRKSTGGSGP